jgi:aspartate-semialdehyde dehydrogenase
VPSRHYCPACKKLRVTDLAVQLTNATEKDFAEAELAVFSNAKNYRRDPLVPLVVPLVNPSHFDILPYQRSHPSNSSLFPKTLSKGCIVANANCSTTGIVVPLKALEDAFGPLDKIVVNTMQAISGGGYPGVSSMDILDNVVPYIGGEEEKIEWETSKILGGLNGEKTAFDHHTPSPLKISASCNRVPVLDGHMEVVSCSFKKQPAPTPEQCIEVLRKYSCEAQQLNCPSAPKEVIHVHDEQDRPQPRLDRYYQNGAGVNVGRVRECPVLDIKFVVLSNNVSIGAATSSIMNAEIAVAKGFV